MQEEHQWTVSTQVPVEERQRHLNQDSGHQHEGDGEAQPDGVLALVVHATHHRGGDELGTVQQCGQHHAERRPDAAVIDHQQDSVVHRGSIVLGLIRHVWRLPLDGVVVLHG